MKTLIALALLLSTFAHAGADRVLIADSISGIATEKNLIKNGGAELPAPINCSAYADAAGTVPVDMTGGSPNTTFARTTTNGEVLDGNGGWKLTISSGASRQGEGFSCLVAIPQGSRGKVLNYTFDFENTGTIVDGDIVPYAYDVDDAKLVAPISVDSKLLGSKGSVSAKFQFDSGSGFLVVRIGMHIARTTTTSLTSLIDNQSLDRHKVVKGMAGSDWQSYSLAIGASTSAPTKGTIVRDKAFWRQVGDQMEIRYEYQQSAAGSAGTGTYKFPLPSGYSIDTSKVSVATGAFGQTLGAATVYNGSTVYQGQVLAYDATDLFLTYDSNANTVGSGGYSLSSSSLWYSFEARVPIAGWSSNVTMGESSTYKISSYLANGTRVTGAAPTVLGQYRSYLRNAGANTYTETNGSPTTTPTVADGVKIYSGNAYSAADTNNQPTKYEVFVGKSKHVKFEFYASTGKTGQANVDVATTGSTAIVRGSRYGYDPTTGIAWITAAYASGAETTQSVGMDGSNNPLSTLYFDIVVSDNANFVGLQGPVTSGSTSAERIERVTLDSSCNITRQSGSWVSSTAHPSTGQCTVTIAAGLFSAPPTCTCSNQDTNGTVCNVNASPTSTSIGLTSSITNTTAVADLAKTAICMGPR